MKKLNQKGIAATLVILVLVLVLGVGGTGYYVYNAKKNTESTLNSAANGQGESQKLETKTTTTTPTKSTSATTNPNAGYLVIKEWGVRIKTTNSSTNLYYKVSSVGNMVIFSKSADAITGSGGVSCKGEYVAYLSRFTVSDIRQNDPQNTGAYTKLKNINGYTYWFSTHKDYEPECFFAKDGKTSDTVAADKFQAITDAFKNDISSIEAKK